MKFFKKNKSEFKKASFFVFMFFMGLSFISHAEELKKEGKVDISSKEIITVEHTEDEKSEDNKKDEKISGVVDYNVYGGGGTKVKLKLNKHINSYKKNITDIGLYAFLGSKITYNIPTFFSPIHFDVKVSVSKKSFYDSDFQVTLPLAYLKLDKLCCFSDFKVGIEKSLFNKVNTGTPQVQAYYEINPSWKLAFGIEASSSDAYFKEKKSDKQAKEINLNSDGTLSSPLTPPKWVMTKTDLNPLGLSFALKYENKDGFEFSSAWIIKCAAPFKLKEMDSGKEMRDICIGFGTNFEATAYLFSKNTKLNIQTMLGRGIGSNMSDINNSFIVDAEADKETRYLRKSGLVGKDSIVVVKTKDGVVGLKKVIGPVMLWGLRFSCGITQKFLRDYSFSLSYSMAAAAETINRMFIVHRKNVGYEKEHKVKGIFTWDINDEGKVKLDLGSAISLGCTKEHPMEVYAGFKVDFSPK